MDPCSQDIGIASEALRRSAIVIACDGGFILLASIRLNPLTAANNLEARDRQLRLIRENDPALHGSARIPAELHSPLVRYAEQATLKHLLLSGMQNGLLV